MNKIKQYKKLCKDNKELLSTKNILKSKNEILVRGLLSIFYKLLFVIKDVDLIKAFIDKYGYNDELCCIFDRFGIKKDNNKIRKLLRKNIHIAFLCILFSRYRLSLKLYGIITIHDLHNSILATDNNTNNEHYINDLFISSPDKSQFDCIECIYFLCDYILSIEDCYIWKTYMYMHNNSTDKYVSDILKYILNNSTDLVISNRHFDEYYLPFFSSYQEQSHTDILINRILSKHITNYYRAIILLFELQRDTTCEIKYEDYEGLCSECPDFVQELVREEYTLFNDICNTIVNNNKDNAELLKCVIKLGYYYNKRTYYLAKKNGNKQCAKYLKKLLLN
jgi:hypothetical protein